MLGWFRSQARCPVDDVTRTWLDERWAWLEEQFGLDRLRKMEVILPSHKYFPDRYEKTTEDVQRMMERVCEYMELDPDSIELSFYRDRKSVYLGGIQEGAAGLYRGGGYKFKVAVEVSNLENPLGLVAVLAHELGHVHLLGHGRITDDEEDHEPLTDLLTVYFGFGVFTANSVVQESHWSAGNSSGWSVGRRGYLTMQQYGYALALFARSREEDGSAWVKELRLDVRAAFKQAKRFVDQQAGANSFKQS
jgi:hypothetical protein